MGKIAPDEWHKRMQQAAQSASGETIGGMETSMSADLDILKLSAMLRAKRGERGLRDVAQEIGGLSASTLSRIEQGNLPDLATFLHICRWLGVSPEEFTVPAVGGGTSPAADQPPVLKPVDKITANLRADRTLDPKTVEALTTMIRLAYEDAERRARQHHETEQG